MRRFWPVALASLALAACDASDPLGLYPEPISEVAAPLAMTGRVTDAADLLTPTQERELTGRLAAVEQATRAQLVVVTTPSLGGQDIADYGLALGRGWGVGSADRNDGLIVLVAPNEREVRIEVGYGLEDTIDDLFAKQVVDEMTPHFRKEDYYGGIAVGVDRLGAKLTLTEIKKAA